AFFASLVAMRDQGFGNLFDLPLHFIGHGRGAVVNSELIERLLHYIKPSGDIHVTTLDAHDGQQNNLQIPIKAMLEGLSRTVKLGALGSLVLAKNPMLALRLKSIADKIDLATDIATFAGFETIDWTNFKDPNVTYWSG